MSSSWAKPCTHQTVAVLAAALAMYGRARMPVATTAAELRNSERLVGLIIGSSFPVRAASPLQAFFRQSVIRRTLEQLGHLLQRLSPPLRRPPQPFRLNLTTAR